MTTVSVVCCCRNEIYTIEIFLRSLESQVLHGIQMDCVIADGESSDGTAAVLGAFAKTRPWMRIITNSGRIASTGLNAAMQVSRGSVVIRMDAHTEYAKDYVTACLSTLERTGAAAVGGPMRLTGRDAWQRAAALAYGSPFFSGGSTVYDILWEGPVKSVLYGCWRRTVIESVGQFDENMVRNQDDEFSLRVAKAGGQSWQSPSICSWYHPRRSAKALARQFFGYGYWKVYTMRKHDTVVSTRHIIPAIVVFAAAISLAGSVVSLSMRIFFLCGLTLYLILLLASLTQLLKNRNDMKLAPALFIIFPTAQFSYGLGTLAGLSWFFKQSGLKPERVPIFQDRRAD